MGTVLTFGHALASWVRHVPLLMSWSDRTENVILGLVANTLFALPLVILTWLLSRSGRRRFARLLGVTAKQPSILVIVSGHYIDGEKFKAKGIEPTARGFQGAALAKPEFEAARKLAERLESTWVRKEGFPWVQRVAVTIRASSNQPDSEASDGYSSTQNQQAAKTHSVVIIGSGAYNSAAHDILGPTIETRGGSSGHAISNWPTSEQARFLIGSSCFRWIRDVTGLPAKSGETPRWRGGVRGFRTATGDTIEDAALIKAGRSQNDESQFSQSIIQQVRCNSSRLRDNGGTPPAYLREMTITLFAGVDDGATQRAVETFLHGERDWRWVISDLHRRHRVPPWRRTVPADRYWPVTWAYWWSTEQDRPGSVSAPDLRPLSRNNQALEALHSADSARELYPSPAQRVSRAAQKMRDANERNDARERSEAVAALDGLIYDLEWPHRHSPAHVDAADPSSPVGLGQEASQQQEFADKLLRIRDLLIDW